MKSRTLSSDLTILRKDLTRFAPIWLGLSVWLTLWGIDMASAEAYYQNVYEPTAVLIAPVTALALFGYLTKPNECVMVHSLPIRRERLFWIHVLAGIVMFLVPTAIFCAATDGLSRQSFGIRLGWTTLEFVFLFSIAILCMMLTGTKLGAALLYFFLQCVSVLVWVIINSLYLPRLPGVHLNSDLAYFSPSLVVNSHADFLSQRPMEAEDWRFVAAILAITAALLLLSLALYRRRKLEHAGDLLAFQWLNPFFACCSGVTGAAATVIFGLDHSWPVLLLGISIGYLAYWMLSRKSARVFTPKILAGLACLAAVLLGSLYVTELDPLGRVRYIPAPEKVASVKLSDSDYALEGYTSTDPDEIEALSELHAGITDWFLANGGNDLDYRDGYGIHVRYTLKNGRTILRRYVLNDKALLQEAAWYLSQPETLFRSAEPVFGSIAVHSFFEKLGYVHEGKAELEQILLEECSQGKMFAFGHEIGSGWSLEAQVGTNRYYVPIPDTAVNTIAWLESHYQEDK